MTTARPPLRRRSGTAVGLAAGVLAGVVVGVVVGPARQAEVTIERDGVAAPVAPGQVPSTGPAEPDATTGPAPTARPTIDVVVPGQPLPPIVAPETESGPGTSTPTPGQTSAPRPGGGTTAQGVASDSIRVGIGVPDLGVLAALGPDFDFGDPADHMQALLEDWRAEGLLPIHGRDLEFFVRRYDIVGTEEMLSACQGWANEDKVFAVLAVQQFWAHAECITDDHGIPMVTSVAYYEDTYRPVGGRLLFDLQVSIERMFKNWVHWMHGEGLLQGRTIGLYRPIGRDALPVTNALVPELKKLGYNVAVEVTTDDNAYGSPQDTVAVQRFRNHVPPVDLALLIVSSINATNFMQQAAAQLYNPTYVGNDYFQVTNDVAASTFPPGQYDGTLGMTSMRYGEEAAGLGIPREAKKCVDNYAERRGKRITYRQRPAEYLMLVSGCDEGDLFLRALQGAGRSLTIDGFVAQMETLRNVPMGIHSDVSFIEGLRGGGHEQRTLQWRASCTCWVAISGWSPFTVR